LSYWNNSAFGESELEGCDYEPSSPLNQDTYFQRRFEDSVGEPLKNGVEEVILLMFDLEKKN